jgi:general secretion pathway protein G
MPSVLQSRYIRRPSRGKKLPRLSAGFTLLELLVVLVILGLLAAVAVPQVMKYLGRSKTDAAKIQVQRLDSILGLYRLDMGRYPTQEEGLQALVTSPPDAQKWSGPYVKNRDSLIDPWGNPYLYRFPGERGEYDLYTFGADGAPGGDGENQDVSN